MTERTINLKDVKARRRAQRLETDLTGLLGALDQVLKLVDPYRFYVPGKDVLRSAQASKMLTSVALKQVRKSLEELE